MPILEHANFWKAIDSNSFLKCDDIVACHSYIERLKDNLSMYTKTSKNMHPIISRIETNERKLYLYRQIEQSFRKNLLKIGLTYPGYKFYLKRLLAFLGVGPQNLFHSRRFSTYAGSAHARVVLYTRLVPMYVIASRRRRRPQDIYTSK